MKSLICLVSFFAMVSANTVQLMNNCGIPLWLAYLGKNGEKSADKLPLLQNQFKEVTPLKEGNSVLIWARTNCNEAGEYCETGDCGPFGCVPATLVEIAYGVNGHLNFYDVSLAEGFNLPISVAPFNTSSEGHVCGTAKCEKNLNEICPNDLIEINDSGETIACLNACARYHTDEFCCSGGENSTQTTCTTSEHSEFFKGACPDAYSYAFDNEATFYCSDDEPDATFEIVFCP